MSTKIISRKDINGQIISKDNYKNYHINFNNNIDIIDVKSYKIYNKIREGGYYDEGEYFEEEDVEEEEKKENILDDYEKPKYDDYASKDPLAFSKGHCLVF